MESKKVTRYYAECGKGFWKKDRALSHEENCKCWKNPKIKGCMSCIHKNLVPDSNGIEHEPQFLQTWQTNNCEHSDLGAPVHKDFDHIRKYCPKYQPK